MASGRIILVLVIFFSFKFSCYCAKTWIQAGYWYVSSESPIPDINSALFTHLICAFANVNSSTYQLSVSSTDEQYFSSFTNIVKRKNPSVLTFLSIWDGVNETQQSILGEKVNSSVLSLMVSQSSYRKSFIKSSIEMARLYGFHGIDLFWLYPHTAADMINLGILLDEWRVAVNSEPRNTSESQLILSMVIHYLPTRDLVTYPIELIQKNMDWAHLMAYDYHLPVRENATRAHAALYDPSSNVSTDFGIREWTGRGFPASKLVLGLPFHGYAWTLVNPQDNIIGAPAKGKALTKDGSVSYKYIMWYLRSYRATTVYNSTYVVNYFVFGLNWVGFDDVEAIKTKIGYAKEKGLLGYNVFMVTNDDNWALSTAAAQDEYEDEHKRWRLLIILLSTAAVILLLVVVTLYLKRRAIKSSGIIEGVAKALSKLNINILSAEDLNENSPNLQVFSFATIKAATNNFSSKNKLGEGGYGPVYKGKLRRGQEIAVKRLSESSNQGQEEFKNEVTLTARLQHVYLARVLGFCTDREEKMLIYEYMPNKSLDLYLFDPNRGYLLDWPKRVHIIEGVAQGLVYLQEYSNFTIIHRDLKASNILLDSEMNPKISDFGMARLFRKDELEANTGRIVGTYGYVPPEYVRKGIYSLKSDVYAFGVLLLQIISSKRNTCSYGLYQNLSLLEYAYDLWKEGQGMQFIDPSLDDSTSSCKLMRCLQVALLCVEENPVNRPSMLEVSSMLKTETADLATPTNPAFSIKKEGKEESKYISRDEIYSVNDTTLSEVVPR